MPFSAVNDCILRFNISQMWWFRQISCKKCLYCIRNVQCSLFCFEKEVDRQKYIYTKGCVGQFEKWLQENLIFVAGIFVGIALLQVSLFPLKFPYMCLKLLSKSNNKADLGHRWHLVVTRCNVNTPRQYGSLLCFQWFWAYVLHPCAELMCCVLSSSDLWDLSCSEPGEWCQSCKSKLVTGEVKPEPCRPTGWARSTWHRVRDVERNCSILNLSTCARNSLLPCLFEGREEYDTPTKQSTPCLPLNSEDGPIYLKVRHFWGGQMYL